VSSGWLVALEILLVLGVVLGFGVRELLSLRRYRRRSPQPPVSAKPPHSSDPGPPADRAR